MAIDIGTIATIAGIAGDIFGGAGEAEQAEEQIRLQNEREERNLQILQQEVDYRKKSDEHERLMRLLEQDQRNDLLMNQAGIYRLNATRELLESQEAARRFKSAGEGDVSLARAKAAASGTTVSGSSAIHLRQMEDELVIENDWILKSGELKAEELERQAIGTLESATFYDYDPGYDYPEYAPFEPISDTPARIGALAGAAGSIVGRVADAGWFES